MNVTSLPSKDRPLGSRGPLRIPHSSFRISGAFTLMELLLAVAVFSIVLAAIGTVFFSAVRLRNKTTTAIEQSLPLHQAVAIIKRDLEGIVVPGTNQLLGPLSTSGTTGAATNTAASSMAGAGSVTFTTTTGMVDNNSPWSEVQRVAYVLVLPTNNAAGKDLVRIVTRNLLPINIAEEEPQFVIGGIENIYCEFYDGTGWTEVWDSTTASPPLPAGIKIVLERARESGDTTLRPPIEIVVPIMVQGTTNATTTATEGGQ